jgi:hypothetical protein
MALSWAGRDVRGTAYVTSSRLAWRPPSGFAFDVPHRAFVYFEPDRERSKFHGMTLGFAPASGGDPDFVFLHASSRKAARRELLNEFFGALVDELLKAHPDWHARDDEQARVIPRMREPSTLIGRALQGRKGRLSS